MAPLPQDPDALATALKVPPPPGSPYSLPIPNSEREGRSAIYRHWRFIDGPLLQTLDPQVLTAHDAFESSVKKHPNARCLGSRPWDPVTKTFGKYEWMTYAETALRRKNVGAGIVELHKKAGVTEEKYGVGLWCQNRPEWQISGKSHPSHYLRTIAETCRLGMHVPISIYRLHIRHSRPRDHRIHYQPCIPCLRYHNYQPYSNPAQACPTDTDIEAHCLLGSS
jgi:long-chain acyl-CoA synthetase